MTNLSKGLLAAVASNLLFSMLFLYGMWMRPMTGTEVFAWRMVAMLSALCVLMTMVNGWQAAAQYRPRLEAVAVDCIADADICQPVVAVCLGAGQWGRGKHCHGLFPVSFGNDAGRTDLV